MSNDNFFGFRVAGVTFEDRQQVLRQIHDDELDFALDFERETDNIHDDNAIKVNIKTNQHDHTIGYVPKEYAPELAAKMDEVLAMDDDKVAKLVTEARLHHGEDTYGVEVFMVFVPPK